MISSGEIGKYYALIGENIRTARMHSKISQEDLAKQLGFISRISVVNIESGKQKVLVHTLAQLSDILNVSIDTLLPDIQILKHPLDAKFEKKIQEATSKEFSNNEAAKNKIKLFVKFSSSIKK